MVVMGDWLVEANAMVAPTKGSGTRSKVLPNFKTLVIVRLQLSLLGPDIIFWVCNAAKVEKKLQATVSIQ